MLGKSSYIMGKSESSANGLVARHPVIANLLIIILVAVLGLVICYFSIAIFTKHGETDVVPKIENISYSDAVRILHEKGFRVDIRDSIYREDIKPGYVIEQFPKANSVVKPGRKIFLYINAVHPKEVVIDTDNNPREDALRSFSFRQGMARLEELGFKNIRVVKILGEDDCIVKVLANGRVVKKTQKVPVNAQITVEVYDGRLRDIRDSLQMAEYPEYDPAYAPEPVTPDYEGESSEYTPEPTPEPVRHESASGSSRGASTSGSSSASSSKSTEEEQEYEYY